MTYSIKKPTYRTETALYADILDEKNKSVDIVYMDIKTRSIKTLYRRCIIGDYGIRNARAQIEKNLCC